MNEKKYQPFVPETMQMTEFTARAVIIGIILTLILGAANAYLGLRAGITIAATYPAAVIGMAALRFFRGSVLEENLCRTAGSIGESVAAGAIFTLPAFVIARAWPSFGFEDAYWKSTALMIVGSVVGVLFVSLVRRVMVEDPELPFPESVAAAEIHKAGQRGAQAVKFLFYNIAIGGATYLLGKFNLFALDHQVKGIAIGSLGQSRVRLGASEQAAAVPAGGFASFSAPEISPAYLGVGYIIGPRLAALQFSGGVMAWGLMVPLLIYFLGPQLAPSFTQNGTTNWDAMAASLWRFVVRPVAVGGMLVGAAYTLYRMRKSLTAGLGRAFEELKGGAPPPESLGRTERYMSSKVVLGLIAVMFVLMIGLYYFFAGHILAAVVSATVMIVIGFFFATVSGSLVGLIGSSNNPISGLTLSTLIIAALLMVALGFTGPAGVAVVLGVAAVVCVSSAVAGELLQDFKVGYILGGTPRTIQIVELIAVVIASLVMYFPLWLLNEGDIRQGGQGFGGRALPAPQAGLMAMLAQGIVGGEMAWPLVVVGMFMGLVMILLQVKSPMLFAVGMYLPFGTTFAIFCGGLTRWIADRVARRQGYNEAQLARVENAGVLTASGLIAGEALVGLIWSAMQFLPAGMIPDFKNHSYLIGLVVLAALATLMVRLPLTNAGSPDEPAPPAAIV
ncbi:MAG: oligopeptide transporter, OPT family [Bryobacteraceae bacterium]|nr:oligopeptide transporter, OPT family [Bryobacteraceae bacterium]MDW8380424.1 oligopeptide transporter, OPT family [Bryobacterales bacterium]